MIGAVQIEKPSGILGLEGFASAVPARVAKFGQWTAAWTGETHIVEGESAFHGEDFRDRWIDLKAWAHKGVGTGTTHKGFQVKLHSADERHNVREFHGSCRFTPEGSDSGGDPPASSVVPSHPIAQEHSRGVAGVVGRRAALCWTDFRGHSSRSWADIAPTKAGKFGSLRARTFRDQP